MTDEPKPEKVLARDVRPYEWAVWCSIQGGKPFANTICNVSWAEDGSKLWFGLDTHNFYDAAPDATLELVRCKLENEWERKHVEDFKLGPRPTAESRLKEAREQQLGPGHTLVVEALDAALAQVKTLKERARELIALANGLASDRLYRWKRATVVEAVVEMAKGFDAALATAPKDGGAMSELGEGPEMTIGPDRVERLETELGLVQAQCAAMREALLAYEAWEAQLIESNGAWGPGSLPRFTQELYESLMEAQAKRNAAIAPNAGRVLLEWKESALRALGEWHEARELIGGAQLGDGPVQWARRVRERLEKAEARARLYERIATNAKPSDEWDRLTKAEALEEAARVADKWNAGIAAAIRALGGKP